MQRTLNDIYGQFTHKAAQGRKMDYDKLEKLARGRVYTGAMATKLGLVDELGTLDDAVKYAAKVAGLPKDEKIERWILPPAVEPVRIDFRLKRFRRGVVGPAHESARPDAGTAFARAGRRAQERPDCRPAGPRIPFDVHAVSNSREVILESRDRRER